MKVFVYGTLKRGHHNHRLLEQATLLGDFTTPPNYTMYHLGGFPAVVMGGDTAIVGEVYEVDRREFQNLDYLEGYPTFYTRDIIETEHGDAWMYHIASEQRHTFTRTIESGNWE